MRLLGAMDLDAPPGRLELLVGDLSSVPDDHAVDVLVVSAFPNDYTPTATSLIGALHRKGLSVSELAASKEYDLRDSFGCWLSRELEPRPGLPFKRILCFEPGGRGKAPELIADIFRALEPFAFAPPYVSSVAMPLVASGDQGFEVEIICAAMVNAAWNRLKEGHPIRKIKIVARTAADGDRAAMFFDAARNGPGKGSIAKISQREAPKGVTQAEDVLRAEATRLGVVGRLISEALDGVSTHSAETVDDRAYDAFVSYSRRDHGAARLVSERLKESGLRVFIDELEIATGYAWQKTIFDALEKCRSVVAIYSPDFVQSKVCQDEFAAAMILRRRRHDAFIVPLLVTDTQLPAYMEMLNYADCRVADPEKLQISATAIAERLNAATMGGLVDLPDAPFD